MRVAIDVETACTIEGCKHHGKSLCAEGHSLNPWASRITVAAAVSDQGHRRVFRGPNLVCDLGDFLAALGDNVEIVGHNFKFDWLHLARHGLVIPLEKWTGDSQLAAYVLPEKIPDSWLEDYTRNAPKGTRKAGKHSLKTLAPYFLGVEPYWEAKTGGEHDDDDYVTTDAEYTLRLVAFLEEKLRSIGYYDFYRDRQLEWTKMLVRAEWRGVCIDMDAVEAKERELRERVVELERKLDEMWADGHEQFYCEKVLELMHRYSNMAKKATGRGLMESPRYLKLMEAAKAKLPRKVDYNSPSQMLWLLQDWCGYDCTNLLGKPSTEAEVLERLAHEGKEDIRTYLDWRAANKILTTYIPNFKSLAVKEGDEWVIHPVFNPDVTRTGRTSSERPNMQNIPGELRPLFKPRRGYKFIGYDQAAIEARLIALYTDDPVMYELIEKNISIHDFNTVNYFELKGVPFSEVKKKYNKERSASKNVGFALFYNAGANRIRIAFTQAGFPISIEKAKAIHQKFKQAFRVAVEYAQKVVRVLEAGAVIPNLLGRPVAIENPEDAYMKAFNSLIQGSASDLLLEGAYRATMKQSEVEMHPLLFVHDFVCVEVREEEAAKADEILKRSLTDFSLRNALGPIPLEVEGGVMDRWEK